MLDVFLDSYYLYVCKGLVSKKTPCTIIIYCYSPRNSREQNKQENRSLKEEEKKEIDDDDDALLPSSRSISENPNSQLAIIQNSREKYRQRWVAHELAHQSQGLTTIIVFLVKQIDK